MGVNVRIRNGMTRTAGAGGASEGDIRGDFSDLIDTIGVADKAGGDLLVHQAASPAMTVVVDGGVGYIPNSSYDNLDSDSIKFWEAVVAGTTASRTLVIGANSSGSTRIDLVCLKIDPGLAPNPTASDVAELTVVVGTAGAGVPATPDYHLKLSEVTVANGASSILTASCADSRVQALIKSDFLPAPVSTFTSNTITSSATPTPIVSAMRNFFTITALAAGATIAAPTGTPVDGMGLILRIKDNGTARSLAFNAIFRALGITLPSITILGKTLYAGCIYNSADSKWDVIAIAQEA